MFFPQTSAALIGAEVASYSADPLYKFAAGGPIVPPVSANLPDLSTPYTAAATSPQDQATDLSFAIAARETLVEYVTSAEISASTDWVIAMPTWRYHLAADYRGPRIVTNRETFGDASAVYFASRTLLGGNLACRGAITTNVIVGRDRDGRNTTSDAIVPSSGFSVCGAVSVLNVNGALPSVSPTLQAQVTTSLLLRPDRGTDGSAIMRWSSLEGNFPSPGPSVLGLPALVRQFSRAVNPQVAPGVSGTYGATWAGRTVLPGLPPR